jgi:hypothetical protein
MRKKMKMNKKIKTKTIIEKKIKSKKIYISNKKPYQTEHYRKTLRRDSEKQSEKLMKIEMYPCTMKLKEKKNDTETKKRR